MAVMYDFIIMFIFQVSEAVNLIQLHNNELLQHTTHLSLEALIYNYLHAFCDGNLVIITFIFYRYTVN